MDTKADLIKRHFYETAIELFRHNKIEEISIGDICKEADFSRTTFYRYFKDKNDFIEYLFDVLVKNKLMKPDIKKNFYKQTIIALRIISNNQGFMKKLLKYRGQNSFREYYAEGIEEYFREIYQEAYNAELGSRINYMIIFNTSGIVSIVEDWLDHDCIEKPKEVTDIIVDCLSPDLRKIIDTDNTKSADH